MTTAVDRDVWVAVRSARSAGSLVYHTRRACQPTASLRATESDARDAGFVICERCERVGSRQERAFHLWSNEGLTYREVAARLNVEGWEEASEYTVRYDITRVRGMGEAL